jgi:hypothetical protein
MAPKPDKRTPTSATEVQDIPKRIEVLADLLKRGFYVFATPFAHLQKPLHVG